MKTDPMIVYVEDDPLSRQVMELLLVRKMRLNNVAIFEDSTNIIQRMEGLNRKPDVFLLDIHMAPHDGFEVNALLRAHPTFANSAIIALTASVMNEDIHRLEQAGFDGVIAKPIDQMSFPDLLSRVLNGEKIWTVT
ncbi:MAG: response regulator [Anaerolineae bacterium]|nr:response regulator [Anaerolineae bacterium]